MKKLLTIIFFLLCLFAKATNYYFSTSTGNDTRTALQASNPATPWKTAAKLTSSFTTLNPGDSALFKRGEVFYGFIQVGKSGTIGAPIIIGAYGVGSKPIITSLVNLSNPVLTGTNIYTFAANSSLLSTCNIVVQNGVTLLPLGRYPNLSAANKGYLIFEARNGVTSITDNQLPLSPNWAGASAFIRRDQTNFEEGLISSHANTTLSFSPQLFSTPVANMGYFFQKDPRTLDFNGEWYYKASTKQIMLYSTTTPTGIQAASLNDLVVSTAFSYITFTGIEFRGSNGDGFDIGTGTGIKIENCDINFCGGNGISTASHLRTQIIGNTISNSMVKGISGAGTGNSKVKNNIIKNTRQIVGMGSGFNSNTSGSGIVYGYYGSNDTIENNLIIASGSFGINFDGDNMIIHNNVIDTFGNKSSDVGGIYNQGAAVRTGVKIIGNIVKNGLPGAVEGGLYPTLAQTTGIYIDNNSSNNFVDSNTVYNCYWGIFLHNGSNNTFTNNTLYSNTIQSYIWSQVVGDKLIRNTVFKKNILFGRLSSQLLNNLRSINNDIRNFGTFDSNWYCRPILEPSGINNSGVASSGGTIYVNPSGGYYSLDRLKIAYSPYEAASKISPKGYDVLRFEVNTSYRDSVVILNDPTNGLPYTYLTAKGVRVKGTLTLAPYTSVVMIRDTVVPAPTANAKPTVSMTSPANGSSYISPASISLAATAGDVDGTIIRVNFFNGSAYLGTDATSPYTLTLINVTAGGYSFNSHAVDDDGDSTISAARTATVTNPPPPNIAPTVSVTSPANNSTHTSPASISLVATAGDVDGTVTQVQFFNGAILLATEFVSPYTFTWNNVPAGNYTLTAKATDNLGLTTTSGAVSFTVQTAPPVNEPPTVSLTSPVNNASYGEPGTVYLAADAGDTDGSITKVEFFNGATLLDTDVDSPYVFTWLSVPAGNYNLTAKATDDSAATTTSAIASITVIANIPPTVSITSPADNSAFTTPADITIDADCNDTDGNITVVDFYIDDIYVGSDSTSPYAFNVSGYTTGTYILSVKATDNSGAVTSSAPITVTVNPPAPLAINIEVEPILCNGGTTTITTGATGGTAPYTGTGSTVVGPGTYTRIVIDDDGTQDTAIITIADPTAISLTDSLGTISNYGGFTTAVVYASGGTGSYQWQINGGQWQNSGTFAIPAGNYVVNVKDENNCTSSISFSITQPTSTGVFNMQIKWQGEHINVNR